MTKDVYYLGSSPSEEPCAQIGDADYADRSLREVRAYIEAIRKVCGEEPDGARLRVKREMHDYGQYVEATIEFDGDNKDAAEYAAMVDEHAPTTWEQAGVANPNAPALEDEGRRYTGVPTDGGLAVTAHEADGESYALPRRFDLRKHSLTGYAHGYLGSGPAQLALALCADATGDDRLALETYQQVKRDLVAPIRGESWELSQAQVLAAVRAADKGRGR